MLALLMLGAVDCKKKKKAAEKARAAEADEAADMIDNAKEMVKDKLKKQFADEFGVDPDEDEGAEGFFEEILEKHMPKEVRDGSKVKREMESFDDMSDEDVWKELRAYGQDKEL